MRSNLISVKAMDEYYKHPRLHVDQSLGEGRSVVLADGQAHYLKNVLRKNPGDKIRLFNEQDGEWLGVLRESSKKSAIAACETLLRGPQTRSRHIHLFFPPLAKDRLDFLIEKAVELGTTDLHPVIIHRSDIRKINEERVRAQIIEAAEQCERHDIPLLHELAPMEIVLAQWDETAPIFAALERADAPSLVHTSATCGLLIGPPGGFTPEEKSDLTHLPFVKPVSLGQTILRTETAALFGLSILRG